MPQVLLLLITGRNIKGIALVNNEQTKDVISKQEAEEQIVIMTKRMPLLYHHTAKVLTEKYGEAKGKKLLHEIIKQYGHESGKAGRGY